MDGTSVSHPSMLVAGTLILGAGSLLVLVLMAAAMLLDSVACLVARREQSWRASLVRLYDQHVSPLVHVPGRRQALRWALAVLLVFAPALPPLEMEGWAPEPRPVLWNVLRIVQLIVDEPGARP